MKVITVSIQKGGTGKTSLSFHLAEHLRNKGKVLAIDLDMQGNFSSMILGNKEIDEKHHIKNIFENKELRPFNAKKNLDVIYSDIELSRFEALGVQDVYALETYLENIKEYDFVIIDTPPSLSIFTANALIPSTDVFVPLDTSRAALKGLNIFLETLPKLEKFRRKRLNLTGIAVMRYKKANFSKAILKNLENAFPENFLEPVRDSIRISEALALGVPVWEIDPRSAVSLDMLKLMNQIEKRLKP